MCGDERTDSANQKTIIIFGTHNLFEIFCIFAAGLSRGSCLILLNKTKRYARLANGNVGNFQYCNASET